MTFSIEILSTFPMWFLLMGFNFMDIDDLYRISYAMFLCLSSGPVLHVLGPCSLSTVSLTCFGEHLVWFLPGIKIAHGERLHVPRGGFMLKEFSYELVIAGSSLALERRDCLGRRRQTSEWLRLLRHLEPDCLQLGVIDTLHRCIIVPSAAFWHSCCSSVSGLSCTLYGCTSSGSR